MSIFIWILIIFVIILLILSLLGIRRIPRRILDMRIARLILKNTTLGDRFCEIFYGVTMVTVVSGMVNVEASGYENIGFVLFVVSLGVNITWGIIDGATSVYGGLVDKAEEDRLVNLLRSDRGNQENREKTTEILEGTIVRSASEEDRSRVVDMIGAGAPEKIGIYSASMDDFKMFLAIFLMDFTTVFPVIIPFYVIKDNQSALFWSHFIAVLLFVIIGMAWARYLNKNMLKVGLALGIIALITIAVTYYFGW
jgi:VIT1/CCC1 family predicted Fe2+/Mn2+ transporter